MRRTITVALLTCAAVGLSGPRALAHGETERDGVSFVVGFAVEPAYIDQPNAVQLIISRGGRPVTDVRPGDLRVTVEFGGERTTVPLEAAFEVGEFGTPGDYRANFIPTQPGRYTFGITGTVGGQEVDLSMTSSPKTFSEVLDTAPAQFPPQNTPSTGDLATRIDAESARTAADVAAANDAADSARTMAVTAGVVASIAVVLAIVAVARSRRQVTA